jgi:hypothetical protein
MCLITSRQKQNGRPTDGTAKMQECNADARTWCVPQDTQGDAKIL